VRINQPPPFAFPRPVQVPFLVPKPLKFLTASLAEALPNNNQRPRLALFYVIPVIDLGLAIRVDNDEPPELKALDGRVTVLLPGNTCLSCRGVTDPVIAAEEAMRREHPAEYEKRKAEAYVFGEGNPSPVVVTFTTELACMAANEMLNRINGFRGPPMKNLVRKFHLLEDFRPGAKPRAGCALCDDARYWGLGDVDPFLDRS
jgi:hypothetical protein